MFNLSPALVSALDAAAPDQATWIAGREAFKATYAAKYSVNQGLYAALDAAAPDQATWIAGREAFKKAYPLWWIGLKGLGLLIGLVIGLLIASLLRWDPVPLILFVALVAVLFGWLGAIIEVREVRAATES